MADVQYVAEVEDVYTKVHTPRDGSPFATFAEARAALLDYFWWAYEWAKDEMASLDFEPYEAGVWCASDKRADSLVFWIKEVAP